MSLLHTIFTSIFLLYGSYEPDQKILFDGVSLIGWQVIDFEGHGNIHVADSCIIIGKGEAISGIKWTKDFPVTNYEVSLEAKRVEGSDFFCGLTVPVKESFITLVLGGWGGSVVGLSSIDGYDASENDTYTLVSFEEDKWYSVRLRITDEKIEAWIDEDKYVNFSIGSHDLSLRWEVESSKPFGITTYRTTGAIRKIRLDTITE
jgi:hypothetical protein